jgi:hypothetical protein
VIQLYYCVFVCLRVYGYRFRSDYIKRNNNNNNNSNFNITTEYGPWLLQWDWSYVKKYY